jgi:peptide/nickel transport system permease protein
VQRYILIRLGQGVLTLIGASILVFALARLTGNPLDVLLPQDAPPEVFHRVSALWGLDRPIYEQYFTFAGNVLKGNFGESFKWRGEPALGLVLNRLPATLQLAALAILISVGLAVPIGVLSAVHRGTWVDSFGKLIALLGQSMPSFWLGIVLIWIFAVHLKWFPTSGRGGLDSMILPALAMGWFSVAAFTRLVRSSMLDVLDTEYVKLARIKGLPEGKVVWKHALKNAAIPPLTYFGLVVAQLLTGSVVIETVFAWPGVGLLALQAVLARDYQVVQAVTLIVSMVFIFMNLVVDILYAYLDPRIRYT